MKPKPICWSLLIYATQVPICAGLANPGACGPIIPPPADWLVSALP